MAVILAVRVVVVVVVAVVTRVPSRARLDGRIVIAGVRGNDSTVGNTWLVRLTARGRLDRSFGGDGQIVAGAVPGFDEAYGVALQPDGRIVVAGDALVSPTDDRLMVGRFRGDPPCFGRAATITGTNQNETLNRGSRWRPRWGSSSPPFRISRPLPRS